MGESWGKGESCGETKEESIGGVIHSIFYCVAVDRGGSCTGCTVPYRLQLPAGYYDDHGERLSRHGIMLGIEWTPARRWDPDANDSPKEMRSLFINVFERLFFPALSITYDRGKIQYVRYNTPYSVLCSLFGSNLLACKKRRPINYWIRSVG